MLNLIPDVSSNRVESQIYDIIIPLMNVNNKTYMYVGSIYIDMNTLDSYICFATYYPEIDEMKFSTIEEAKAIISSRLDEEFF